MEGVFAGGHARARNGEQSVSDLQAVTREVLEWEQVASIPKCRWMSARKLAGKWWVFLEKGGTMRLLAKLRPARFSSF